MAGTAVVVGGGPGGLMAAEVLATAGWAVTVYERMPSVGRKLLLAGRGGLNLTHSEPIEAFLNRYGTARPTLEAAIRSFGPDDLRAWCEGLGEDTFVGTSGRVFPTALRATSLLRAWLARLDELGVVIRTRHSWTGWDAAGRLTFIAGDGAEVLAAADVTVLALGGASWPSVGSDGAWTAPVAAADIGLAPLRPANSGFRVTWSEVFRNRFAGKPVKNVGVTVAGESVRGELMITDSGIEGGAVYAVSSRLRDAIEAHGPTEIYLDLRPDVAVAELTVRLAARRAGETAASLLRRAGGLPAVAAGLLREATGNRLPTPAEDLAARIKRAPITVLGPESIDRAISTAGGVLLDEVDATFMVRRRPGTFVVGEMLDWEAPTGGYLLQACFSTAMAAARGAVNWAGAAPPS
ncbi:MAG TPA: TIGR03862 family flavoprotein [Acidimicrobiales bacterium]